MCQLFLESGRIPYLNTYILKMDFQIYTITAESSMLKSVKSRFYNVMKNEWMWLMWKKNYLVGFSSIEARKWDEHTQYFANDFKRHSLNSSILSIHY